MASPFACESCFLLALFVPPARRWLVIVHCDKRLELPYGRWRWRKQRNLRFSWSGTGRLTALSLTHFALLTDGSARTATATVSRKSTKRDCSSKRSLAKQSEPRASVPCFAKPELAALPPALGNGSLSHQRMAILL